MDLVEIGGNLMEEIETEVVAGLPAVVPVVRNLPTADAQAESDDQAIGLWLSSLSEGTRDAYQKELTRFMAAVGHKPLGAVTLSDITAFKKGLAGSDLSAATQARRLSAAKSLMSFCHEIGWLRFNPAAAVKAPKVHSRLAQRILDQEDVLAMIALEPKQRDQAILRLAYRGGLRAAEIAGLTWGDLVARQGKVAGQATVVGKGEKERVVVLDARTWAALLTLCPAPALDALADDQRAWPVFASRKGGGHMDTSAIRRLFTKAAERIGKKVSPHWFRHASASHALDAGAPIHVVQQSLGHASLASTSRYVHARPQDGLALYLDRVVEVEHG